MGFVLKLNREGEIMMTEKYPTWLEGRSSRSKRKAIAMEFPAMAEIFCWYASATTKRKRSIPVTRGAWIEIPRLPYLLKLNA